MSKTYVKQLSHTIQEELDQLEKYKSLVLEAQDIVKHDYKPLFANWVFKIKKDMYRITAKFKA